MNIRFFRQVSFDKGNKRFSLVRQVRLFDVVMDSLGYGMGDIALHEIRNKFSLAFKPFLDFLVEIANFAIQDGPGSFFQFQKVVFCFGDTVADGMIGAENDIIVFF